VHVAVVVDLCLRQARSGQGCKQHYSLLQLPCHIHHADSYTSLFDCGVAFVGNTPPPPLLRSLSSLQRVVEAFEADKQELQQDNTALRKALHDLQVRQTALQCMRSAAEDMAGALLLMMFLVFMEQDLLSRAPACC
jgi:hypothetical protein